ncbi:hypothetical protein [Neisseria dentiae]|uniref:hypothetical protein n=1 Tax=Neisseria dentiae TaxID=194197 RepID=UPI0035A01F9D
MMLKIMVLSDKLQEQSARAEAIQKRAAAKIESGLADMDRTIDEAMRRHMSAVREDVAREVLAGSRESVAQFTSELEDLKRHMMDFAQFSVDMERKMDKTGKILAKRFILPAALLAVTMSAVIAAAIWLGTHYRNVIENSKIEAALLEQYENSALYLCDSKYLCAKTTKTPTQYRKQGYVFIAPKNQAGK